jgi:TRAP-type C4-dicarboxylate transport system substrate-binding protein
MTIFGSRWTRRAGAVLAAAGIIAVAGCSSSSGGDPTGAPTDAGGDLSDLQPVHLVIAELSPQGGSGGQSMDAFLAYLEDNSDGKITGEINYAGALLPVQQAPEGIGAGIAQAGNVAVNAAPEVLPVAQILPNQGYYHSDSYPQGILGTTAAATESFLTDPDLVAELDAKNLVPLAANNAAQSYDLLCNANSPIRSLADAEGKRTRQAGAAWVGELETIGMVPTQVQVADLYDTFQKGGVDCSAAAVNTVKAWGILDFATQYTPSVLSSSPSNVLVVNKQVWDGLPEDGKQLFRDAGKEWFKVKTWAVLQELVNFATVDAEEFGIELNKAPDVNKKLRDYQEATYGTVTGDYPGVDDPQTIADGYRSAVDEWEGYISDDLGVPESFADDADTIAEVFPDSVTEEQVGQLADALYAKIYG